jgi:hypothetical protein
MEGREHDPLIAFDGMMAIQALILLDDAIFREES